MNVTTKQTDLGPETTSQSRTQITTADVSKPFVKTPAGGRKPRLRLRVVLISIAVVAALAWGVNYGIHLWHYEETDNAYIIGHVHQVSAQISGQVKSVLVKDNEFVKAGQPIVEIDTLEYEIAVQKATAAFAQAHAQKTQVAAAIEQAKSGLVEAQARVAQAESQINQINAQLTLNRLTLERNEKLFSNGNGAVTQADVDTARSAFDSTTAALAAARANLAAAQAAAISATASQAATAAQADAAIANIAAAEAALREANRQLAETHVNALVDGRIGARSVETGNRVQAGQLLCALAEPEVWVVANFKETQLTHMREGQEVEINIDALPDEKITGHIDSFSPASGAQFALLPPDNATGNFNKVVQRIPVKILIDPATVARLGNRLHLGYSVVVEVRVR